MRRAYEHSVLLSVVMDIVDVLSGTRKKARVFHPAHGIAHVGQRSHGVIHDGVSLVRLPRFFGRFARREQYCGSPCNGIDCHRATGVFARSEEHTSELQSLMRISYAVFCLKKKNKNTIQK